MTVLVVLIIVTVRRFKGWAPGVGGETDGAVKQVGTANHGMDAEYVRATSQGLRNCGEPV